MTSAPALVPVIMSGGSGTRLWPLSTEKSPKQFHALTSLQTMFQETVLRLRACDMIDFTAPIIICNRAHPELVRAQLKALDVEPLAIVLESFGRNTAAVAVIAARLASELQPGVSVLLQPADHVIADWKTFLTAIERGARLADRVVTFGIEPTEPQTGYGYIQCGIAIVDGVFAVARFVEKPSRRAAQASIEEGGYYCNGGIFLFAPNTLLGEFQKLQPDILGPATVSLTKAKHSGGIYELPDDLFAEIPSESLDVAVMERTRRATVAPFAAGWADVGSWSELFRMGNRDELDNLTQGNVTAIDAQGSFLWSDGVPLAVIGLQDMIVVVADAGVVVLPSARAQEVKALAGRLGGPINETSPW